MPRISFTLVSSPLSSRQPERWFHFFTALYICVWHQHPPFAVTFNLFRVLVKDVYTKCVPHSLTCWAWRKNRSWIIPPGRPDISKSLISEHVLLHIAVWWGWSWSFYRAKTRQFYKVATFIKYLFLGVKLSYFRHSLLHRTCWIYPFRQNGP